MEEELGQNQGRGEEPGEQNQQERAPALPEGRAGGRGGETARQLIGQAKRATRRKFPAEEKIRIVMEGIRAEVSIADLCRREGIPPTIYSKWLKDFMEAGKGRLRGDARREATSDEVPQLGGENERRKQLVADLSLENLALKRSPY